MGESEKVDVNSVPRLLARGEVCAESMVWLTNDPIDSQQVSDLVRRACCGALVTFDGMTRDNFEGKEVVELAYEAYVPMALEEMKRIKKRAEEAFPGNCCAIVHRLGIVPVKESSVVIAVSSPHRKEAFNCCSSVLEEIKATLPVWKKEVYAEDRSQWKENAEWSKK